MSDTDRGDSLDRSLFGGTAWYYARYRPSYPPAFFNDVVQRLGLDGTGRLLDLGCGTGQLTLPLASHFTEAIGIDPEADMLTEADRQAREHAVTNVSWTQGDSATLPAELGRFRVVTMGRCFHWMDREQVLAVLGGMVDADGSLVIANDTNLLLPATLWQQAIQDLQRHFLPAEHQPAPTPASSAQRTHEEVLANSPFPQVNRHTYEFRRSWTVEQIIGYLYATSLPLRRLLGDRRNAFEEAIAHNLLAIDPAGHFTESVTLEVLIATKN